MRPFPSTTRSGPTFNGSGPDATILVRFWANETDPTRVNAPTSHYLLTSSHRPYRRVATDPTRR